MTRQAPEKEGRTSAFCSYALYRLYHRIALPSFRSALRRIILKREGGPFYSETVRKLYTQLHGIRVGLYTMGPLEAGPDLLDSGTSIGRYSSVYYTVCTITTDPTTIGESKLGAYSELVASSPASSPGSKPSLDIGNDVFIGHNSIVLPSTRSIGDGAFVGAGSVVKKDVPPYAVVMGNPARVVRYRFSESTISRLLEEKWWLQSITSIRENIHEFTSPLD